MRAHVADWSAAPVNPAAPIKGVVDRVIRNFGTDAKEEIPRERVRNRIAAGERCRKALVYAVAVPLQTVGGNAERFRARNALRPEAKRTIGPDVNFANFADGAGLNVFDGEAGLFGREGVIGPFCGGLCFFWFLCQRARLPR